jgi:hypothetical protein
MGNAQWESSTFGPDEKTGRLKSILGTALNRTGRAEGVALERAAGGATPPVAYLCLSSDVSGARHEFRYTVVPWEGARCAAREIMRRQSRGSRTGWRCGLGSERLAPRGPSPPLLMPYAARPPAACLPAARALPVPAAVPPTAAATPLQRENAHTALAIANRCANTFAPINQHIPISQISADFITCSHMSDARCAHFYSIFSIGEHINSYIYRHASTPADTIDPGM